MNLQSFIANNTDVGIEPQLQPRPHVREYPLSLHQQQVWSQCLIDPESILYNLGARMAISGPLDVPTFLRAIQNAVDRHEILRTIFTMSEDIPVRATAQVMNNVTIQCPVRTLPALTAAESEERAWSRMNILAKESFDLAAGPLFRTELLRCGDSKFYFILAFHYLILDAFYCGQLMQEIASAYDLLRRGEPLPPAPDLQYGDFSMWLQERWNRQCLEQKASFWQKQLQEPLPELHLPIAHSALIPRPLTSQVTLRLESEIVAKLNEVSNQYQTTVFRVVVATLVLFFSRLTETNELMFDIDFSIRPKEMSHTIGSFTNNLPVRFEVQVEESFHDLLRTVDSQLRQAAENREFPVRRIAPMLTRPQDAIRPLSSVRVMPLDPLDLGAGEVHLTGSVCMTATAYDLYITVMERGDTLEINLGYADELFEQNRTQRWAVSLKKLLGEVASQPDAPIAHLDALAELKEERQALSGIASATS